MKLISNWEEVLGNAWNIRFGILAAIFGAAETFCLLLDKVILDAPPGLFAGISTVFTAMAVVARVLDQSNISPKKVLPVEE